MNKILFFSIVIPTYNRATFIAKTIDSVLIQSYQNFEIIIVDDGSTDNTEEVVRNISSNKIKYFKITNSERAAARNYGTLKSKGDYVTFLDSDDILLPDYFSNAVESINKYHNPPFLHLGYEIINPDDSLLFRINDLKNDDIDFLIRGNSLSCMGCFLREDISKTFLFNEDRDLSGSEDWELWFRVLANLGIKTDNRISARMYNHENRSVIAEAQEKKLLKRMELVLKYAFMDRNVKEYFEKYYSQIVAFSNSYIALHLSLLGERKKSIYYTIQFLKDYPLGVFSKRFLVINKRILQNLLSSTHTIKKEDFIAETKVQPNFNSNKIIQSTIYKNTTDHPLVTIIIPCFNAEKFIEDTIHSVIAQTYLNFELLILNDGSTDYTENVINKITDNRLHYIVKKNTGVSDTRNIGLELSKGEYVLFLDADDVLSTTFIEKHVNYLEENKNFGFTSSEVIKINEDGMPISTKTWKGTSTNILEDVLSYNIDIITSPSNYLIRKSVLINHSLKFNIRLSSSEDRYFLIELSKYAYGALIREGCNLHYRVHKTSISNNVTENLLKSSILFQRKVLSTKNIPRQLKSRFLFRTNYIFAGNYFKLKKALPCIEYTIKAFYSSPKLFVKEVIKSKKTK